MTKRIRLNPEDIIVGLDLAGEEHQAVIMRMEGERLTRFRVPHSLRGFEDLLQRYRMAPHWLLIPPLRPKSAMPTQPRLQWDCRASCSHGIR